uniref:WW-binding domain-containing protein n=1 Tax=Denticeps clupeoides TaxID=299321 RepID=A0AAY4A824_9TELE
FSGLSLYFEDGHDDLDDFGFDDYGSDCDGIRITAFLDAGQDDLTPLGRLEKYAFSENVFNRQIVARGLLDVLREFSDNENDFISVMETVARMSEDGGMFVRCRTLPCFYMRTDPTFQHHFPDTLCPLWLCLSVCAAQVRKTSQAALLVLMEQGLVSKSDMEGRVCPILLDLTEPSSDDDYKIEAVAIMCKLVTMLSKDTVEHLLLLRFCELCCDTRLFQVRKVCAANFGEFCAIVGLEATEKLLMPKFFELCSDSLWGIRKACAECFMTVSNCTSPEVRRSKLSPLFISLISDQSRWVRQAAFQSLGRFISTFANPASIGLHFREDGSLREIRLSCISRHFRGQSLYLQSSVTQSSEHMSPTSTEQNQNPSHKSLSHEDVNNPAQNMTPTKTPVDPYQTSPPPSEPEQESLDTFNSFLYWRPPLPDISLELELLQVERPEGELLTLDAEGPATSSQIQKVLDCLQLHMDDPDVQAQVQVLSAALKAAQLESQSDVAEQEDSLSESNLSPQEASTESSTSQTLSVGGAHIPPDLAASYIVFACVNSSATLFFQNVIPQQLLDQYLSMTDPARAQTVDTEIAKHCAFSLPGVALTLGRQNWHCLKDTYETLASDVQWKVRRTLAFSIHELAVILGDQLTAADLVPIFNGFLKDLDEVRIGVLKHLYDFLKLLHLEKRREYLYQLQEFLVTDNSRNWRFRYELAEQLILIIDLYSHNDVYDYLRQIALSLCSDKVSEVRWISYKLVVEILQKLYSSGADDLGLNFANELVLRFCHCPKWVGRQAFAFVCQAIVEDRSMPMDQFAQHLLPSLLSLTSDPVANVRVLVAKALRQSVVENAYFKSPGGAYLDALDEAMLSLQADKDRDVRFFATLDNAQHNTINSTSVI